MSNSSSTEASPTQGVHYVKKSISFPEEMLEFSKRRCKEQVRTLSSYVQYLIEQDRKRASMGLPPVEEAA